MKITKYPQSCLLVEKEGKRLLIDPGSFAFEKFRADDFGTLDAILVTHQHPDHFDKEKILEIMKTGVPFYANEDVVAQLKEEDVEMSKIEHGVNIEVAGFDIKPVDLPHFKMKDGSDGPLNTGYLIDGVFFHPGDGIELSGEKADNVAVPISGPTVTPESAWKLAENLEAKKVLPIHFSNPQWPVDPQGFAGQKPSDVEVIVLKDGESTEV